MIGDIIEMARARATLGDVMHSDAAAPRRGIDASGRVHTNADDDEAADAGRWSWASLVRTTAQLFRDY